MNSRFERFMEWRKDNAEAERSSFNTADVIYRYVAKQVDFEQIDSEFCEQFDLLETYSRRSTGSLIFLKLVFDEYLTAIPNGEASYQLRTKTIQLSSLLTLLYELPVVAVSNRVDIVSKQLLPVLQEFLEEGNGVFANISRNKSLFLLSALYFTVRMIVPTLESMNWIITAIIYKVIPEDKIKEIVNGLLEKIKAKGAEIAALPSSLENEHETFSWLTLAQNRLNNFYLKNFSPIASLNGHDETWASMLLLLDKDVGNAIEKIDKLIALYGEKTALEEKRAKIIALHSAAIINDEQITGQLYLLDLIKENEEEYKVFSELEAECSIEFHTKLKQLKAAREQQVLPTRIAKGLSTVASPVIESYRKVIPQMIRGTVKEVVSYVPFLNTLDSQCKRLFQRLLRQCESNLMSQIAHKKQDITNLTHDLFEEDMLLIPEENPVQMLHALKEQNREVMEVLKKYQQWFKLIQKNKAVLREYNDYYHDLDNFFQKHNIFWVRFTNFLAQFSSFFKTNTAAFLDEVRAHRNALDAVMCEHRNIIEEQELLIIEDTLLPEELKAQLKIQLSQAEAVAINAHLSYKIPNTTKPDVRLLLGKLSKLGIFTPQFKPDSSSDDVAFSRII